MTTRLAGLISRSAIALMMLGLLVTAASCSGNPAQTTSYTVADSTGDWGYPSPYAHYSRGPGYTRMHFVFETLVWKDATDFVPQLASDWEYIAGENAYIFTLQQGVRWHDGTEFTAQDVVFTFEYTKEHPYAWVDNTIVESAEALGDYEVKLYLSQSYAPFLQDVAGTQPIMPKHIWEGVDEPEQFTGPEAVVGTGPYTLADYSKEHGTYLYQAFDDYYLGEPTVDQIKFIRVSEEMTPAALQEGSASAGSVPPEIVSAMEDAGLTVITAPAAWNAKMMMNHHEEPLSSKEFRHALAYAIDRESLVAITQRGHAVPGSAGMIPPTSSWYNADAADYPYDPAQSKALLEGLGYTLDDGYFARDGQVLELELLATTEFKEVGQFIKNQLEAVGIKVDFRTMEAKTVDAKVEAWDFDLSIYGHGGLYEPSILNTVITGAGFNSARYDSNDELNQLLQAQLTEMDPDEREAIVHQIQQIYAEDLPALTLYYPDWYWAHDGSVDIFFTKDGMASGIPIPLNRLAFVE